MHELWTANLSWDQPVPSAISSKWNSIAEDLQHINSIHLPRWIQLSSTSNVQLHGYADASGKAYGAVVYLRVQQDDQSWVSTILASKSRVAPLKVISLPRLELQAAVLLSKLLQRIQGILKIPDDNLYAWSDSTITLAWLSKPPSSWKIYVANRVSEVHSNLPPSVWRHVRTAENPAYLVSRGCSIQELKTSNLWWQGPQWLNGSEEFPRTQTTEIENSEAMECEARKIQVLHTTKHEGLVTNISSFLKAESVVGWILRFANNCRRNTAERITDPHLTFVERNQARSAIWRNVQLQYFPQEYSALQKGEALPGSSQLKNLHPYMDSEGVLRVTGRLQQSTLKEAKKHPIILHPNSQTVRSFVEWIHVTLLHSGPELTQAHLQESVWILKCRNLVRYTAFSL